MFLNIFYQKLNLTNMNKRMITVLDNGGETLDRYTIIDRKNGDVFGASAHPSRPLGFGMFSHNIADMYWNVAYGYSWKKHCDVEKCTKFAIKNYLGDCSNIGVKIPLSEVPKEVLKYIENLFVNSI